MPYAPTNPTFCDCGPDSRGRALFERAFATFPVSVRRSALCGRSRARARGPSSCELIDHRRNARIDTPLSRTAVSRSHSMRARQAMARTARAQQGLPFFSRGCTGGRAVRRIWNERDFRTIPRSRGCSAAADGGGSCRWAIIICSAARLSNGDRPVSKKNHGAPMLVDVANGSRLGITGALEGM